MKVERRPVQQYLHPRGTSPAGAGRGFSRLSPDRQPSDQLASDIANEPRVVMIGVIRSGRDMGAVPFEFFPFHGGRYGD